MEEIICISATKAEIKIIEERLAILEDKKEELFTRYLGLHSAGGSLFKGSKSDYSKVIAYLHKVEVEKQPNGMTIKEEIEKLNNRRAYLLGRLENMLSTLKTLTGIEYQIYYKIVVDGLKVTEAVEKVAEENYISKETAWRRYKTLKKLTVK